MKTLRPSVYELEPQQLSELLADPAVNRNEHEIYWPRFRAMLPEEASHVLDFGCGAGNFTQQLADKYPMAHILGVDAVVELLPASTEQVSFRQWDGRTPLITDERFDLIVAKMALHYLSDDQLRSLASNLLRVLAPGGRIAFSVPHPEDSEVYNDRKRTEWQRRNGTGSITRTIGGTGLRATMFHRNMGEYVQWINKPLRAAGLNYAIVIDDDIYDEKGMPKRLDLMFVPLNDPEYSRSLARIDELAGPPQEWSVAVDPKSAIGKELLEGDLSAYPDKPLPY